MENEKILSNEELLEITAGFSAVKSSSTIINRPLLKYGIRPGHPTTKYGIVPPTHPVMKYGIYYTSK